MFTVNINSNMKQLLFVLLLVALTTCIFVATTECALVTTAEIQDCISDEDGLECEKKMVVGVTVSDGLTTTLDAVLQGEALEETVRIEITKTPTKVIYPLTYLHTALYYPPNHELKFDGFEIKDQVRTYNVKIKVTKGSESEDIELSTDNPFAVTTPVLFKMRAELIGDFPAPTAPPELDSYILYIPSDPDTYPMVKDYQNNMLLVPREEVSKFGDECNKVGVSPTSGLECFQNKLFDKHNRDLQKLILGPDTETTYLVHGMKKFKSMNFKTGMEKRLEYTVPEVSNAQIALTMDDAEIKVINTQSMGVIVEAFVETFDCMSREGTLKVEIQNVGDFPSDYVVTVTNATVNIVDAIPAQTKSLHPEKNADLTFDVHTNYNMDTTNEFLVTMKSPTGHEYDKVWVIFDTMKYKVNQPPVADAGGPYEAVYNGGTFPVQLNGTASYEPDDVVGDVITSYIWTTDCPCATFDDPASPTPILSLDPGYGTCCTVTLEVRDKQGVRSTDSTTITIADPVVWRWMWMSRRRWR